MTQRERDRLVALKKASKGLITQQQAAEEMGMTARHVRRLLKRLKQERDKVVIHGLRGKSSNRRTAVEIREKIKTIFSDPKVSDFGPTLASEHLAEKHGIHIGREALRGILTEAGAWKPKPRRNKKKHQWRERRTRFGELVQWDTSDHDWLEGRGEQVHLIHMIDDATSRLMGRFVPHDSTVENMEMLERWLTRHGRPLAFYSDKDSIFYNAPKRQDGADVKQMPPTQVGRALEELQIVGILAHSPEAKGRVERSFQTAQDRLVKGMRLAGVTTCEQANAYLEEKFLPWWDANCTVQPAHPDDAHRKLGRDHDLKAILSHVEQRKITNDHTFRYGGKMFRIPPSDIVTGLRGSKVRIENRRDGSMAVRFGDRYLQFAECQRPVKAAPVSKSPRKSSPKSKSTWMRDFELNKSPSLGSLYASGSINRF